MIIYGTGNFNRRNPSVVRCTCPSCGRRDYQCSYTSTRFFTLYFIPVIPLGSQKVLHQCQHCKNAFGISLSDYKRRIKTELPQAIENYRQDPTNAERAEQLLAQLVRTQQTATLKDFAPQIATNFPRNSQLLCQLAEACSYLCLDALADDYFLLSINAGEDPEIAANAERHMKQKAKKKPTPPNRFLQSLPILIVPGILIFLLANYLSSALSNRPEQIYVVNGLDQAYDVYVNDKLVHLAPYERIEGTMLHYDQNTIRPVPGSLPIEQQTFPIGSSSLKAHGFDDTVFVVNPDRAALFVWQRISYSSDLDPEDKSRSKILTGKVAYAQDGIDFPFTEFPDEIYASTNSRNIFRTRLEQITDTPAADIISYFLENDLSVELETYLAAALKFEKFDGNLIRKGFEILKAEKFNSLARPHLAALPVEVEWHRAYQDLQNSAQTLAMEANYRDRYEEDPENNQLAYLYARTCDDPDQAKQIFSKAANSSRPSGYASYGLSYYYLLDADFENAVKYSEQASRWLPANPIFNYTRKIALHCLEDYETIANEARETLASEFDFEALYEFAYANTKLGNSTETRERIAQELQAWQTQYEIPEATTASTRISFDRVIALANADKSAYLEIAKQGATPHDQFESHILQGRLYDAIYLASTSPESFDSSDLLLLSILTKQAGNEALFQRERDATVSALKASSGRKGALWAAWLSGEPLPKHSKILQTCTDLDQQFLLLAALGTSLGDEGTPFIEHARKLAYRESFYSLALKDAQVF